MREIGAIIKYYIHPIFVSSPLPPELAWDVFEHDFAAGHHLVDLLLLQFHLFVMLKVLYIFGVL